ncbi:MULTISPECIES: hydroxymethylbilane synthase [Listeria]|uniref:hydroxymethylbilane synthase n=1 Tax=Listeria TaxID=1637 RepID=UPI000B58E2CC|nr:MULTISPECIES: hydroxymethylbilane synthase [Listeria]
MKREIIVGSRKSKLALTQTGHVISALQAKFPDVTFKIHEIVTKGDRILDVTLSKVGGKGLFVSEVEQALVDKKIDFAVHSMKDVPSELQEGLTIGAIPKRESPYDCVVFAEKTNLDELPQGAVIGTSSLRRASMLKRYRADFQIKSIRGNIDTRLKKLYAEDFDAILLAEAGLSRMGWLSDETLRRQTLDATTCLPAVGQGALAIECRNDDAEVLAMLSEIHDTETAFCVRAERAFLKTLNGGCEIPIAGFAQKEADGGLVFTGFVGSVDGMTRLDVQTSGDTPETIGIEAANILLKQGAKELIDALRSL